MPEEKKYEVALLEDEFYVLKRNENGILVKYARTGQIALPAIEITDVMNGQIS